MWELKKILVDILFENIPCLWIEAPDDDKTGSTKSFKRSLWPRPGSLAATKDWKNSNMAFNAAPYNKIRKVKLIKIYEISDWQRDNF